MGSSEFILRRAAADDACRILELIQELADFEKEPDAPSLSKEQLILDGFSESPRFEVTLAEVGSEVVGMSLVYERYSTWMGRSLYLEDLIVSESHRGIGIGKALMEAAIKKAREGDYSRLEWQVLDWNTSAIDFYKQLGAELDESWINCRIAFE